MKEKSPKVKQSIMVSKNLWKAFKILAVEKEVTISSLLEEAMRDLLRKYGRPAPEEGQGKD